MSTVAEVKAIAFREAERTQGSLLAPLEKKCLLWLAERMPCWVNSDHLTLLGFGAMVAAGASYWLARWNRYALLLAIFWLGVNWFGDSLDGTLARVRSRQRPRYGFYVDHILDSLGALFLLGGLALSGYMNPKIATGVLVAYLLLSIEAYLATYALGVFRISIAKLSPTELRILLALGNLALFFQPVLQIQGMTYRLFDIGGVVAIAGMTLMLLASVVKHTAALYRAERLP